MPAITIEFLNSVLHACRSNQVTEFKTENLEIKFGSFGSLQANQPVPTESTEPIELTEDMPSDDELLFGASGFAVNRE
jgi:hypothetical protein